MSARWRASLVALCLAVLAVYLIVGVSAIPNAPAQATSVSGSRPLSVRMVAGDPEGLVASSDPFVPVAAWTADHATIRAVITAGCFATPTAALVGRAVVVAVPSATGACAAVGGFVTLYVAVPQGAVSAASVPMVVTTPAGVVTLHAEEASAHPAACLTADLEARVSTPETGGETDYQDIVVTNTSAEQCWIAGAATVRAFDDEGRRIQHSNAPGRGGDEPVLVAPGGIAVERLEIRGTELYPAAECRAKHAASLTVELTPRYPLTAPFDAWICAANVRQWGVQPFVDHRTVHTTGWQGDPVVVADWASPADVKPRDVGEGPVAVWQDTRRRIALLAVSSCGVRPGAVTAVDASTIEFLLDIMPGDYSCPAVLALRPAVWTFDVPAGIDTAGDVAVRMVDNSVKAGKHRTRSTIPVVDTAVLHTPCTADRVVATARLGADLETVAEVTLSSRDGAACVIGAADVSAYDAAGTALSDPVVPPLDVPTGTPIVVGAGGIAVVRLLGPTQSVGMSQCRVAHASSLRVALGFPDPVSVPLAVDVCDGWTYSGTAEQALG